MLYIQYQLRGEKMIYSLGNTKPIIADDVFIAPDAQVIGNVEIKSKSSVWFGTVIRADQGKIEIGQGSNIQDLCVLHIDDKHPLTIGNEVTVGHKATLHGCKVGDRALIGMGATVMNGAIIGEESIIAAGALVTEGTEIPPRTLAIGIPAKPKKDLSPEQIKALKRSADVYIANAERFLKDLKLVK